MKFIFTAVLVLVTIVGHAQTDSIFVSKALLHRTFSGVADSTDYFLAAAITDVTFFFAHENSVYLLDGDTVLSPNHDDELDLIYWDTGSAALAYEGMFNYAAARSSSFYSAVKSGLFCARSGDTVFLVWHMHDVSRYDEIGTRRYFRSSRFDESFELHGRAVRLRKRDPVSREL